MALKLTKRDHFLFQALASFGIMTTRQINQTIFPGVNYKTVLRRLGKLEKLRMLAKTRCGRGGIYVWFLKSAAAKRIGEDAHVKAINRNMVEHDELANEVRLVLQKSSAFLQWKSGHYLRYIQGKAVDRLSHHDVIPDWLARVDTPRGLQNLALEVELSYKGKNRMYDVFRSYCRKAELISSVWYFVPTQPFGKRVAKVAHEIHQHNSLCDSWFYWCLLNDFLRDPASTPFYGLEGVKFLEGLIRIPADGSADNVSKRICS